MKWIPGLMVHRILISHVQDTDDGNAPDGSQDTDDGNAPMVHMYRILMMGMPPMVHRILMMGMPPAVRTVRMTQVNPGC